MRRTARASTDRHVLRAALCASVSAVALIACGPLEEPLVESPEPEPTGEAAQAETVAGAVQSSCTTTSVWGLSQQIVAQAECISPGAYVAIPAQGNLSLGAAAFPYLEQPAVDALVGALGDMPNTTMTVTSMLRTVAAQYLLYQWYLNGMCGIGLAASPGKSNHETGLALDVSNHDTWQSTLEAHGFTWLGASDPVHFDYSGAGAVDYKGTDVLAFQQLWNKNHPQDLIDEDGIYGPQTEARLVQSPADGFAVGASCGGGGPDIVPSLSTSAADVLDDGASEGVPDAFERDALALTASFLNQGAAAADGLVVGLHLASPYLTASDYLIETDAGHPGTFSTADADSDPANPAHGSALAADFQLVLGPTAAGETKRVTLTAQAGAYSIGQTTDPLAEAFVVDVAGHYHQDTFGGQVDNDGTQTFGAGRLEVAEPLDVYSHARWEWDTDRLEGWVGTLGATLSTASGALSLSGNEDAAMKIEGLDLDVGLLGSVTLRARRTSGEGPLELRFATADDPTLDSAKALAFDLPADGNYHDLSGTFGDHPDWVGKVDVLAVVAFAKVAGSIDLDSLRVGPLEGTSGSGGGDPTGSSSSGGIHGVGASDESASSEGSCALSTSTPREPGRALGLLALAFAALAGARRRTRHPC